MKYRKDFVTNSSSSSFIVTRKDDTFIEIDDYIDKPYILGQNETTDFGRGNWKEYRSFHTKINYLALNCLFSPDETLWQHNLEFVLKKHLRCSYVDWEFLSELENDYDAYVDHQSTISERPDFEVLLTDIDVCERFLFGKQSVIYFGGDEYEPSSEQEQEIEKYHNDSRFETFPKDIEYLF